MREGLRGLVAAGAGGRAVIVPGWVSMEVTLTRSHLVQATRVELGEAHKGIGRHRGAVLVSWRVRRDQPPLFHEEVSAQELELGVGAAQGGRRVDFAEQVRRGDGEGRAAVQAEEEEH